ncbi:MAG: hypothetical protein JNM93_06960 [Bacteriovoracaceae bacterium]|nr:hypothetical protein [Bacteriovoracaceae bacterium]
MTKGFIFFLALTLFSSAWAQILPNGTSTNPFGQQPVPTGTNNPNQQKYETPKNVGGGGVELSEIPIAVSSKCNSVILKGTKSYNNTAFLMPKATIARDSYGDYLIEVVPNRDGLYNLRITVSFAEVIPDPLADGILANKIVGCDYEELKFKVNNYLAKVGAKVDTLATLPVSHIAFEFGLNGKIFKDKLGTDETNSLNYLKEANILEFKVSKEEIEEFIELVNGRLGLNLKLDVNFTAKREVGRVFVEVDNKSLAADVEAQLNGKAKVTYLDLQAAVSRSINATNSTIVVEGGDVNGHLFEVAQRIIMSVLNVSGLNDSGYGGGFPNYGFPNNGWNNGGFNPMNPSGGMTNQGGGNGTIDRWRNRRQPIFNGGNQNQNPGNGNGTSPFPGPNPNPTNPTNPGPQPDPTGKGLIDVKAFVGLLKDTKNMNFNYVLMGSAQNFIYRTVSNMVLNISDLFLKKTSFSTAEVRRMPFYLKQGESFSFSINNKRTNKIDYIERKNYFNKSDILNNDKLKDIFKILQAVSEGNLKDVGELNEDKAEYRWYKWLWYTPVTSPIPVPYRTSAQYYWGSYTYEIKSSKVNEQYLEIESLEELKRYPIRFTFSRTGSKRFSVSKLFTPNEYWTAKFNSFTGIVTFQAKKELGIMEVVYDGSPDTKKIKLNHGFFQEFKNSSGSKFTKIALEQDDFPTQEEVLEVTTSRFWADEDLKATAQSFNFY